MTTGARGAALALRALSIGFRVQGARRLQVFDGVDWDLPAGTQAALTGPSGSGKTTLLNALAGIEPASPGAVRWDGVDLAALGAAGRDAWRRAHLGYVFQQFHLFPGLDALGNVLLPFTFSAWRADAAARTHAASLLERVGVRADADVRVLSRGEQQRVSLVRALAGRPKIVLADEPTASLDHDTAATVFALLQELCRDGGATLVVATHDRGLAARLDAAYEIGARQLAPQRAG